MTHESAVQHFYQMLVGKNIRVRLGTPGSDMGIEGNEEEVDYVDKPMTFSVEELEPVREHFTTPLIHESEHGFNSIPSVSFKKWVTFIVNPDWFDDGPDKVAGGTFADLS